MSRFFIHLFQKRALVLGIFAVSSIVFLLFTLRIQLRADILDLLPAKDPIVANYRLIQTRLKQLYETPAPYLAQMFARDPLNMDEMLLRKLNFIGISAES